jgi:chromosome segregation protein
METQAELTEHRLLHSSLSQQTEHTRAQHRAGMARLEELARIVQGRTRGLQSYEEGIARLVAESEKVTAGFAGLEDEVTRLNEQAATLRGNRAQRQADVDRAETKLHELRRTLDDARNRRAHTEVQLAEARMRRQNHLDRLLTDYHLAAEELPREPEPEWPADRPMPPEEIDSRVAELRGQIDAMGPVNLVAIDEYRELEERHTFLVAQEDDLVKGKEQILELIKRINVESSELFRATFTKANENFQMMFGKLFNGGTAQLVLLDSEDVLECGIDIIARPPGKRLQSVSLLSGGERTMTAVALLFAIYMIKPSPFALLDELDAALDDSNIGRFVKALKEFLEMSQFLIITHNQHTIAGADIVYGVTMPEKGISRIVSMRLKQIGVAELEVGDPDAPAPEPEPETKPRKRRRKAEQPTDDAAPAESSGESTAEA